MSSTNRENMERPDFMSDEDWEMIKDQTSSLGRIRGDAKADVERYLANPEGWSTGAGSPSGFPTLLLTCLDIFGPIRNRPIQIKHSILLILKGQFD